MNKRQAKAAIENLNEVFYPADQLMQFEAVEFRELIANKEQPVTSIENPFIFKEDNKVQRR